LLQLYNTILFLLKQNIFMKMYTEQTFFISLLGKWCGKSISAHASLQPYHYYTAPLEYYLHGDRPKYLIEKIPGGKNVHRRNVWGEKVSNWLYSSNWIYYTFFFYHKLLPTKLRLENSFCKTLLISDWIWIIRCVILNMRPL